MHSVDRYLKSTTDYFRITIHPIKDDREVATKSRVFIKEVFDIVKNVFAAAFLKALARNSHSHRLAILGGFMEALIAGYASSYVYGFTFTFYHGRKQHLILKLLSFSAAIILATSIYLLVNIGTSSMVEAIARIQTK